MRTEPITQPQYRFLVGLYKKFGIFKVIPDNKRDAAAEISRLTTAQRKQVTQ